jgi:hypothetical protein
MARRRTLCTTHRVRELDSDDEGATRACELRRFSGGLRADARARLAPPRGADRASLRPHWATVAVSGRSSGIAGPVPPAAHCQSQPPRPRRGQWQAPVQKGALNSATGALSCDTGQRLGP